MLMYITSDRHQLKSDVKYKFNENVFHVITTFDCDVSGRPTRYYFINETRDGETITQYIVVVDESRCHVYETTFGSANVCSLNSIGVSQNPTDDSDLHLYYNVNTEVKQGDLIGGRYNVVHIGKKLTLFDIQEEETISVSLDSPESAEQLHYFDIEMVD